MSKAPEHDLSARSKLNYRGSYRKVQYADGTVSAVLTENMARRHVEIYPSTRLLGPVKLAKVA